MSDPGAFGDILHGIGDRIDEEMSEKDVENAFLNEGFYAALGYEGAGHDLRSEWTLPDNRRPDYVTLDGTESVTTIYEFKTSGRDLGPHTDQLFHYVDALKADYGVLTNGDELRLYKRGSRDPLLAVSLTDATESDARDLFSALEKPEWDITDPESVDAFLSGLDPVELDTELGQEHFFDTFRLEAGSPFADLVTASMDLLHELRDEQDKTFVEGAYEFWETSYASEPDDVPDSWETFVGDDHSLMDFMFCLESGHALLSRLLLAKAADDHDFFPNPVLERFFTEIQGFGDEIQVDVYPAGASDFLDEMHRELVESLFEDDIFVWWIDGYGEAIDSLHGSSSSRFRDIIQGTTEVTAIDRATKERFSRAVAHVLYSIVKFDFSAVEGDPLGDLYQRYFDPETRKALGEFYTPQPVIDYIMDGVGYDAGVSNERLIDPSCGSGTFLVEAVSRYLDDVRRFDDDPDWETHLTELCTRPHIVGLDVHPFAVLMAQIRFMVAILPEYREAKRENASFTIRRLPIFRTDTLQNERESTGEDLGESGQRQLTFDAVTEDNQDVLIPVPLPVEAKEGEETERDSDFLVRRVRMPLFDTIQLQTGVSNFGEYFAALQGVLDVVKYHMSEGLWEYRGGLDEGINRYTTREYDGVDEFFAPYVDDMLETVRYLKDEHNDGRLFKMFEDTVLAVVVKNYLDYEYVVGNPPYVEIQNLPKHQKAYLSNIYETATGQYDIYCPFYERGINWLSDDDGRLGFITPNQFMVTDYGEGVRRYILENTRVEEVYDFRDSGVFKDATNYPAIVILEADSDEVSQKSNEIRGVRVKANVTDESGRALDKAIIQAVRDHRGEPGYGDEYIDVFDYPQSKLGNEYWALMPLHEQEIIDKMQANGDERMADVTDAIFPGPTTGANTVFVVDVVDANQVLSGDTGDTVTIVPSGGDQEFEVETDLLRPWLSGRDVQRWRCEWSGQHVILPYSSFSEGTRGEQLISKATFEEDYPLTWTYLKAHEDELRRREGGRWEDEDCWWEFAYPRNLERFERPKTIFAHITASPSFMLDESGTWYFKTAYAALLSEEWQDRTEEITCQLNSGALEYYFKHIATVKAGGYYEYRAQYVNPLPCVTTDQDGEFAEMRKHARKIVDTIDLDSKTDRFPEAYLGSFTGELEYVDYEWQTRRYPVDAEIQARTDGTFAVEAGRSDSIVGPQIDSEERAEYVHAAVDGRNVKSGEAMSIPIPRRNEDVTALLAELRDDEQTVAEMDIAELEAEIDRTVYDLFELSEDEREVVEEYLNVF